jgi:hypothetical protein
LATVRDRALLEPVVEYADEAANASQAAHVRLAAEKEDGFRPEAGRLVQQWGSEQGAVENSRIPGEARNRAASDRAREIELRARLGL